MVDDEWKSKNGGKPNFLWAAGFCRNFQNSLTLILSLQRGTIPLISSKFGNHWAPLGVFGIEVPEVRMLLHVKVMRVIYLKPVLRQTHH